MEDKMLKRSILIISFILLNVIQGNIFAQEFNNSQLKYSAEIDTSWIRHYNSGLLAGKIQIAAMTIDDQGNVYCAGMIKNLTSGEDYMTIKYNSDGIKISDNTY